MKRINTILIMVLTISFISCRGVNDPYIEQTVRYVHDDYNYEVPSDTLVLYDGDTLISYDYFKGYVLTTKSDDFKSVVMGNYKFIKNNKCKEYNKIKNKQVELNKLRKLKNCD